MVVSGGNCGRWGGRRGRLRICDSELLALGIAGWERGWTDGDGVLKVGVESILVLVFLLDVEVGDGHVDGGSRRERTATLSCLDAVRPFGDIRQVGEAGCDWRIGVAAGSSINNSMLKMPSVGFPRESGCAVIAFGRTVQLIGSFLELPNSAPKGYARPRRGRR